MKNPWGRSGSEINPYLRFAICLVTGLAIGIGIGSLPSPWGAVGTVVALIAAIVLVVHTLLWLSKSKRELDEAIEKLQSSLDSKSE